MKTFFQSVLKHIDKLDERKLREQYRIATQEIAFLETVLKAMKEGVVVYDQNGVETFRNSAAIGLPDFDLPLGSASKNEFAVSYPEEKIYEVQTIPTKGYTLALYRDISAEKKRSEEELASGAAKSIADLAVGVAHEIGNPLNAIALNIQLIERDPTDKESIQICKDQIKRLDGIIRGFLSALRPRKPNLMPGSLADPLKNCLKTMKEQFVERSISVNLDLPAALPPVALDISQMEQVFFNLIKNALEAIKDGGVIDIELSCDDSYVFAKFRDNGLGMSPDQLVNLFEPYKTTKEKGTGLGLMITRRIVSEHGGTISAESKLGSGTLFTIKIPRIEKRVRALK